MSQLSLIHIFQIHTSNILHVESVQSPLVTEVFTSGACLTTHPIFWITTLERYCMFSDIMSFSNKFVHIAHAILTQTFSGTMTSLQVISQMLKWNRCSRVNELAHMHTIYICTEIDLSDRRSKHHYSLFGISMGCTLFRKYEIDCIYRMLIHHVIHWILTEERTQVLLMELSVPFVCMDYAKE